jgi:hypothetical protein
MTTQRTPAQKALDTLSVYEQFRDAITTERMRGLLNDMTGEQMQDVAKSGDVQAYAALVQASLSLQKLVSANDRAALLGAAIVTQSGVVKPVFEGDNDNV